jgi:hypothetical protein
MNAARFATTSCSQCGCDTGPSDHGFSHCADHEKAAIEADLAYNQDKAHRLNNEAFIRAMRDQISDKSGAKP